MKYSENQKVGEIVADNFNLAQIFKSHDIDFCCKGNRTLDEACESSKVDVSKLLIQLDKESAKTDNARADFASMNQHELIDYILENHHKYVEQKIPQIKEYVAKIADVHDDRHEELFEIRHLFEKSAGELAAHMKKEEIILFPFVKKLEDAAESGSEPPTPGFGTVENPINMMKDDHSEEGERFAKIQDLTNNYTTPKDGCNTYEVTLKMLKEFHNDLLQHIHLENNILFPRALAMEKTV
ncbi:iron-sulfur cluster repair di-iron protein [Salibacter halophilus]|uniref:Iron-sulfur cluster repair di-iron protein n=1 Tax=Salibacter halophilus TaxID=1803916 RepID=A0A6N6M861_9FLAO|nr:iron-sulfur cluster repair di-iron protein [Salibacter halophilus]KAB1064427.1 iron-sulfur cluster repair di-iron protein [Salibacter halophilus]